MATTLMEPDDNGQRIDLREILRKRDTTPQPRDPRVIAVTPPASDRRARIVAIRLDTMKIDRSYQRDEVDTRLVNQIANHFEPWLYKPLTANRRENGEVFIVDGQHRQMGRIAGGQGDEKVPVELFTGLTYAEEAELYYKLNTRSRPLSARQLFKGAIAAGDPEAIAIKETVERAGFRVDASDHNQTGGNITAVSALRFVMQQYRQGTLEQTLALIGDTWGRRVGPSSPLIKYMATFVRDYNGILNRDRFVKRLGRLDPQRLVKNAHEATKTSGLQRDVQWNLMVVKEYNTDLKNEANRIPNILELEASRG